MSEQLFKTAGEGRLKREHPGNSHACYTSYLGGFSYVYWQCAWSSDENSWHFDGSLLRVPVEGTAKTCNWKSNLQSCDTINISLAIKFVALCSGTIENFQVLFSLILLITNILTTIVLVDPKLLYCFLSLGLILSLLISKAVTTLVHLLFEVQQRQSIYKAHTANTSFSRGFPKPCSSPALSHYCFSFPLELLPFISASPALTHN